MKTNYSISIPKSCHEDWSKMSPNEKGRFCLSCSKTVVDFTTMKVGEIQNYIHLNKNQRICGHIRQSQLSAINLKIPQTVFFETNNFHRLFLLALLLAMGTTLLNCSDDQGKKQKINSIEVVEAQQKSIDTILNYESKNRIQLDSVEPKEKKTSKTKMIEQQLLDGMMIIETVGDIEITPNDMDDIKSINIDSLEIETPSHCPGPEGEIVFGLLVVENPPEFVDTPDNLSRSEKKEYFSKHVSKIVSENFDIEIAKNLGLKGKQRIFTQFKINEKGYVRDIKVRKSSHLDLEREAIRVIKLLPRFKPAKQHNKNVVTIHTLPILFIVENN